MPSLAGSSRYSAINECFPAPSRDSGEFVEAVVRLAERERIDVILPMTEISTLLLTRHRHRLPIACQLPFPSYDSVRLASNKAECLELARRLGMQTPASHTIFSATPDLDDMQKLGYPVVIKPACSRVLTSGGWIANSVSYASDFGELRRRLADLPLEAYPVILQERIRGPGIGIFFLFSNGRCVARFSHRRLREKPPSGGVSVLCESIAVDPVVAERAEILLGSLEWCGPAMVEFKRDERDGSLRLMEINGRFWGSLQLAIDAGINFPALLVDHATRVTPTQPSTYRTGIRCRWLAGDLDSLLLVLLKSRRQLHLPASHPGALKSCFSFLRPSTRNERFEIERRDDLAPAWLEWRRRLLGD